MKSISIISLLALLSLTGYSFAQTQQGYVKTKGRMISGKYYAGKRISDATVQVKDRSAVRSRADGSFSFPVPGKSYSLQQVQKQGFVLLDQDVLYRQYTYSSNPLVIVMEDKAQLEADHRALERQVRRVTDDELRRRGEELEALKEQNKITEEKYRELLNKLNNDYDLNEKLIKDMVEQYNKIDFDSVDEFNRRVSDCIINGRFHEADSLIRSKGSFARREAELSQFSAANDADRKALEQREEAEKTLRNDLAQDYYQMYSNFKAQLQFDSAAHYIEKRHFLDTNNVEWIGDCNSFFYFIANYDKALEYLSKALTTRKGTVGETHPDVATLYNNIGLIYKKQGDYTKAMKCYTTAMDILENTVDSNHPEIATTYNNIGSIYSSQGDYTKAINYYTKAMDIRKSTLGEIHPDLASSYNNIGSVYSKQGNYIKALEFYNKALSIRKLIWGENNLDVATSYNNIGSVYHYQGDYTNAQEYFTKALVIQKNILGENHPNVATSHNNIGLVYSKLGNLPKALEHLNKALIISKKNMGEKHPDVAASYINIGTIYAKQDNYTNAQEYFTKALVIQKNIFGETHPDVAYSYNNIGFVYKKQGDYNKALENYTKALAIRKNIFGENHPDVATSYYNIGGVYEKQGDYKKAKEYKTKALNVFKNTLGENHKYTQRCQADVDRLTSFLESNKNVHK